MNCFVFDIDGTLIDTAAVDQQSFQQALREFGYHYSLEELRFSFGMSGRKSLEKLAIPPERIEPVMARWETLSRDRLHEVEVYEGIIPLLEALHAAGKRCGIVTSRTRLQLGYGFTPLGLNHYFDAIVCADDVEHPKPAPDGLVECIRRLGGSAEQAVYIGDSAYDMQCAAAAGVKSALALWGSETPDALQADMRLAHPSELLLL